MKTKVSSILFSILLTATALFSVGCDLDDYEQEVFPYADYREVNAKQIVKSIEVNPASVAKSMEGHNLKIVGARIANIDASGTQFSLNCGEIFVDSIVCTVEEDSEAQQQLLRLSIGQPVEIYGTLERVERVTNLGDFFSSSAHVGDIYGCVISVVRIETPQKKPAKAVRNAEV